MDATRNPLLALADTSEDEGRLWLRWLVRLRWVAIAAQIITVSAMMRVLDGPDVLLWVFAIETVLVLGNLRALYRLARPEPVAQRTLIWQLGLDSAALTAFFFLADGPGNPFTVLYVIHVAMGAVMLNPRAAWGMAAFAIVCYASLYVGHRPLHLEHHTLGAPLLRNLGFAMAFAITTISVSGFVIGVASTLRQRSRQLLEARDRTARTDRLRSVGTLAAGAAHELNTPLGTVGLRLRRIGRRHDDPETLADIQAMRGQLERCEAIVQQLLVGAGDPSASELARSELGALVAETVSRWTRGTGFEVALRDESDGVEVEVPSIAFTQALVNLLENAREAQLELSCTKPIEVRVAREPGRGLVVVRDRGVGLPGETDRVGDPFFTTKPTGTGLGVYVARAVADGSGGGLRYVPARDRGTEAHWWFPEADRRSP